MNRRASAHPLRLKLLPAALWSLGLLSLPAFGAPDGGVVRAGSATITQSGTNTRIDQSSDRAIIDWRAFGIGTAETVLFNQPGRTSATLNRVTGDQLSLILGRLEANGQVFLVNPNGIIFGAGAQINVGSLIATTANIGNADFMAGRLQFAEPGRPGAGIANAGTITAADGGLVALVAPHVRNDGLIQARLGKVLLGAADTFTLDLYGDGLINLAFADQGRNPLQDENGRPLASLIAQAGQIKADGGEAVLVTAPLARAVLDQVINLSGTIQADRAEAQGGRIVLSGAGGGVEVSGQLLARGQGAGDTGGTIEVLGDQVHLATGSRLDASGPAGGGTIRVGGDFQGQGSAWRAQEARVDAGVRLDADATAAGNGGQVIVWADGHTAYAGEISARGGAAGGDGGRVEVSGKQTLDFLGYVDAGAARGANGFLLLDPATLNIGLGEAGLISRVLRTGTSTTVTASGDINVNAVIDGRGRVAGAGLTMSAGGNLNINDYIVTNNGALNLYAVGTVQMAAGKAVFSGSAPIAVRAGGNLSTGAYVTTGALSIQSTGGSVSVDGLIDGNTRAVAINAALGLTVNQPILNMRSGSPLTLTAGGDVTVNAPIDGRGGTAGAGLTLTAGGNVAINDFIVTNNGAIDLNAGATFQVAGGKAVFADTAPIAVTAGGNLYTGPFVTSGTLSIQSTGGSVSVDGLIDGNTHAVSINAAQGLTVNQPILNMRSGSPLTLTAGGDVTINAPIDGRGGTAGAGFTLTAGGNVAINDFIVTNNGAIDLHAGTTFQVAGGKAIFADTAPIAVTAGGNLYTGPFVTSGTLSISSTGGSVSVDSLIDGNTHAVTINAAQGLTVNQPILNMRSGSPLTLTAGGDVTINAPIDGRGGTAGAGFTLTAGGNVAINDFIVTNNGAISVDSTGGAASFAPGVGLFAGSGAINFAAANSFSTGALVTTGTLNVESRTGTLTVAAPIDGATGPVTLSAGTDVNIAQSIVNSRADAPLTITAGRDILVNAQIDGRDGNAASPSGTTTLTAARNVVLNKSVVTENAAVNVTATAGTVNAPTLVAGTVTLDVNGHPVGEGLFAGTGPISVTTGGDLATGVYGTTGTLALRSTGGAVTVNTPIDESLGNTTIQSGTAINVNQKIANLKSGHNLNIDAGTSLNVNAKITGEVDPAVVGDSAIAGGAATLVAGTNVVVHQDISIYDGALSVTATAGSLNIDAGKELRAGTGTISVTTAGNLSNSRILRTSDSGNLNLTSTGGDVAIDVKIPNMNGTVTINAHNGAQINQEIITNSKAVSITAGSGGITMASSGADKIDPITLLPTTGPAEIDSRAANTTLTAAGDISLTEVKTAQTLNVTSTAGRILAGTAGHSRNALDADGDNAYPQTINLAAAEGIVNFMTSPGSQVTATSSGGAINLTVLFPSRLRITTLSPTLGDITTAGDVGVDAVLNAGRDIAYSSRELRGGSVTLIAGRDINLSYTETDSLTMTAGRDINFSSVIWLNHGALSATAGHDIVASDATYSNIHITGGYTPPFQSAEPLHAATLQAGHSVTLQKLETLGAVSITASTGNIVLNAPIGPTYQAPPDCTDNVACHGFIYNSATPPPYYYALPDQGVASLTLSAPNGSITMGGARATGNIDATFGTLTSSREIVSTGGAVSLTGGSTTLNQGVAIGSQAQVLKNPLVAPAVPPGPVPATPPPGADGVVALAPIIPDVPVFGAAADPGATGGSGPADPGATGGSGPATPGATGGSGAVAPAAAGDADASASDADAAARNSVTASAQTVVEGAAGAGTGESPAAPGSLLLVFDGGRGDAQNADLGRSGAFGTVLDVFGEENRRSGGDGDTPR